MNKEQAYKRIIELTDILNKANYDYHTLDKPTISDYDYDKYLKELNELESLYPEFLFETSPSQKVGGEVLKEFSKVTHKYPMISLADVFNLDELDNFISKIEFKGHDFELIAELKIDGLAINLEYEKGIFKQALTRGNGKVGEDVTNNIKTIKSIPLKLNKEIDVLVRGEIYMPNKSFIKLNEERYNENKELFANPRNAAAGTIRQLDSKIVAKRNLASFIYTLVNPEKYNINTQKEALNFMESLGFVVNKNFKTVKSIKELNEAILNYDVLRKSIGYETDGVVIKVNDFHLQQEVGSTVKYPKWAVAYKFKPEQKETLLKNIIFQVGRTGVITPVAELEPVLISGSTVSRATLHNEEFIREKDLRIGDTVFIHKAGEIIPEILSVDETKPRGNKDFEMIKNCPRCNSLLQKIEDNIDWFCLNDNCSGKNISFLVHFASRNCMDISTLGEKVIFKFHQEDLLNNIIDIYELKNHYDYLINLEGFGKQSINKLLESIENSKKKPFSNLFYSLGIKNVGAKVANLIVKKFNNIDNIINAKIDDFIQIKDIGEKIGNSIIEYFSKEENLKLIEYFKNNNFNLFEEIKNLNSKFSSLTFVLTGKLENYSREDAQKLIESFGGEFSNSVSKNTSYVIVGDKPGSKFEKAQKLGIKIIDESEFIKLINE